MDADCQRALERALVNAGWRPPSAENDSAAPYLRFHYRNWRGEDHWYVIEVESLAYRNPHKVNAEGWEVNGNVVTRDGSTRPELGDDRRRSFKLVNMKNISEIERGRE